MNPYLLPLAQQHQQEIRRQVDGEQQLKSSFPAPDPSIPEDLSSPSLVAPSARSFLGIFRRRGKMVGPELTDCQ